MKRPLLSLTIVATSLLPLVARAQIPDFVQPGLVVTYSGTVGQTPDFDFGQGKFFYSSQTPSTQKITVNAVTLNSDGTTKVSGMTELTNYLTVGGNGNFTSGTTTVTWDCHVNPNLQPNSSCVIHSSQLLGVIAQFWVNTTNPTASIGTPEGHPYIPYTGPNPTGVSPPPPAIAMTCPDTIGNITCIVYDQLIPPSGQSSPRSICGECLLLAFDPTGLIKYSSQFLDGSATLNGDIGELVYTLTNTISWQVAGTNLLLQADTGEVRIWTNGAQVSLGTPQPQTDYNTVTGQGGTPSWHLRSTNYTKKQNFDVLWQNNYGNIVIWELNGSSGTNLVFNGVVGTASPGWRAVGTGDFFNRGVSDILFQNISGEVTIWQMNGFQATPYSIVPGDDPQPPGWHAIGTGDFDGDGFADILFQHDDGAVAIWEMDGSKATKSSIPVKLYGYVDLPGPGWHAVGTGDFFGRRVSDILFQHDDGAVAIWEMNGTVANELYVDNPGPQWHVRGVCNCNQSQKSDILFQNDSGEVVIWEMINTSSYGHRSLGNPGSGSHL